MKWPLVACKGFAVSGYPAVTYVSRMSRADLSPTEYQSWTQRSNVSMWYFRATMGLVSARAREMLMDFCVRRSFDGSATQPSKP